MLPSPLNAILEEYTEDDYSFYLARAELSDRVLTLTVDLQVEDPYGKGSIRQQWIIEAGGYRKSRIVPGYSSWLELVTEHPLLWEFTEEHGSLYFNGWVQDPARLFYDLYTAHRNLFGPHEPFNPFIDLHTPGMLSFSYSNGLLAQGPRSLLTAYAACLEERGVAHSLAGQWNPDQGHRNGREAEKKDPQLLLLEGSYVIAECFSFRLAEPG
ncbi:MAG TPA: hypothetical protein VHK69_18275 [Chitinophagaceae bacterium]|jgi:hypothetical protein|nr:hypothetical protein [Chitinophagaceae bacterium]